MCGWGAAGLHVLQSRPSAKLCRTWSLKSRCCPPTWTRQEAHAFARLCAPSWPRLAPARRFHAPPAPLPQAWLPDFIEKPLIDLLTFTVGVEEAALRGRLRLTLRPLLGRLPVVGAVQVSMQDLRGAAESWFMVRLPPPNTHRPPPPPHTHHAQVAFVEQPLVDFDLTLGGSHHVPLEPSIKTWLKQ